jgi:hypothetical protein
MPQAATQALAKLGSPNGLNNSGGFMGRSLVIARVGPESLHRCWIDPASRELGTSISLPSKIGSQDGLDCIVGDVIAGPK